MDELADSTAPIEKAKNGREIFSDKIADEIVAACGSGFTLEKAGALVGVNLFALGRRESLNSASEWRRPEKSMNCPYCATSNWQERKAGKQKHGLRNVFTIMEFHRLGCKSPKMSPTESAETWPHFSRGLQSAKNHTTKKLHNLKIIH